MTRAKHISICISLIIFILLSKHSGAQSKFSFSGYISEMGQYTDASFVDPMFDNIVHNRINLAYYANDKFTLHTQFRNQFIWGSTVEFTPGYSEGLDADKGFADMSFNWWSGGNNVMNTQFDRAYVEYVNGNFEMSVGRQRINWGRTLVWNPNDLFNAFSYYDFDYPERPGSDAVRFNYYLGTASSAELVAKVDSSAKVTVAGLYKFNKWSYDIQFIAGYVNEEDIVIGTGWEGSFGPVSFRGEGSYYQPVDNFSDSVGVLLSSVSFDYLIGDKLTTQFELLYNDKKTVQNFSNGAMLFSAPSSSKSLSFSEFNFLGGFMYQASPIISTNLSAMFYPDHNGFFLMPSVDISITDNLYFTAMYYYLNMEMMNLSVQSNMFFARIKWNF